MRLSPRTETRKNAVVFYHDRRIRPNLPLTVNEPPESDVLRGRDRMRPEREKHQCKHVLLMYWSSVQRL
jgi:hypothetical protein